MTEEEWLACAEPVRMLAFLHGKVSDRKLRLFGCACCRRLWHWMSAKECRLAVEVAERLAEGTATNAERRAAAKALFAPGVAGPDWTISTASFAAGKSAFRAARGGSETGSYVVAAVASGRHFGGNDPAWDEAIGLERQRQTVVLRDIFGDPFRPVAFDPRWRTADVVGVARGIYEERAFDRLPVLADALMDAGCDSDDILGHCRSGGPHARGCWAVDLVLGKE